MTTNISFGSTYRVPLNQLKINPAKKDALKALAEKWNGITPTYRKGNVKFSVPKRYDKQIEAELKLKGFLQYDKVEIHRVPKGQLVDALDYKGRFASKKPNFVPTGNQ